jgi:hypothetical protein
MKLLKIAGVLVVTSALGYLAYATYESVRLDSCYSDRKHFYAALLEKTETAEEGCLTLEGSVRLECLQDLKTRTELAMEESEAYFIKRNCPQ